MADDQRAPLDEQPIALAMAEEAGTLPDEDRRVAEDEPVPAPAPDPVIEAPPERVALAVIPREEALALLDTATNDTGYAQRDALAALRALVTG